MDFHSKENFDFHQINQKKKEIDSLIQLSIEYCQKLGSMLNLIHRKEYSEKFWQILLFDYVHSYLKRGGNFENPNKLRTLKNNVLRTNIIGIGKKILISFNFFKVRVFISFKDTIVIKKAIPKNEVKNALFIEEVDLFFKPKPNKTFKERLISFTSNSDDVHIMKLMENLPDFAGSYFSNICKIIPIVSPEKKSFHILGNVSGITSLFLALYREKGATLHGYQHGSHYGEMHQFGFTEFLKFDYFHTWGWKLRANDIPSKSTRLTNFKEEFLKTKANKGLLYDLLILTSTPDRKYLDRELSKLSFLLKNLDRKKFKEIIVRPRPVSRFELTSVFDEVIRQNNVTKDQAYRNIAETAGLSKLIIHLQGPNTTMLECFQINHPVISIYNFNPIPTEIVLPIYDFFFQVGVFHHSIEDLMGFLNNTEIDGWWQNVSNSKLFAEYKQQFANG